jgi:hypothetical protein
MFWKLKEWKLGEFNLLIWKYSGFGGLEVVCWPLVPEFTGSNPAEAIGFFG